MLEGLEGWKAGPGSEYFGVYFDAFSRLMQNGNFMLGCKVVGHRSCIYVQASTSNILENRAMLCLQTADDGDLERVSAGMCCVFWLLSVLRYVLVPGYLSKSHKICSPVGSVLLRQTSSKRFLVGDFLLGKLHGTSTNARPRQLSNKQVML